MRATLLILGATLAVACGPPTPQRCCLITTVARGTAYSGTIQPTNGGTPTQVSVVASASGNTTVTFTRDGREIVQAFNSARASP